MVAKRPGWKTKDLRRLMKRCEIDMRRADRAMIRYTDARRHECGGRLYMRRLPHCLCLGPVNRSHWHLTCENCGDIPQHERELRARRARTGG